MSDGRATADGDGARIGVDIGGTFTDLVTVRDGAAEVLETAYPLRVERYAFRQDFGGVCEFCGGLGPVEDRDPEAVRRDVRLGKVSRAAAREAYGVELGGVGGEEDDGE